MASLSLFVGSRLKVEGNKNLRATKIMVLSALIAFGAIAGASEGLKASQNKARREEHRSRKNNLIANVLKSSEYSQVLEGRRIVLSGEKVCPTPLPPSPHSSLLAGYPNSRL